jgi:hypothetical protein
LLTALFTAYVLTYPHYINIVLLAIATGSYFFKRQTGHVTIFITLAFGLFAGASFTVSVYTFSIFGLSFRWTYLLPILFLFIVQWKFEMDEKERKS